MAAYILRNIDAELWKQIKSKAALEGVSVKALIERLLRDWLSEKGPRTTYALPDGRQMSVRGRLDDPPE